MRFIFSSSVHNSAKDLQMVWVATVKMRSELRGKIEGTFLLPLVFFLWLQANFKAVQSPGIGLSSIRKRIFRLSCLTFLRNYCPRGLLLNCSNRNCPKTSHHRIHRICWYISMHLLEWQGVILVEFFIRLLRVTVSNAVWVHSISAWMPTFWELGLIEF